MAGSVLTTMLVPVGIAYAVASGRARASTACTPPSSRCSPTRCSVPSRILVLGPDSSLAPVILAVVLPLSGGDPMRAVAVASLMAVVSGLVCILAGVMRLGFVTELLSKPIRYGYMNGIALTVLISQLPKLFGFSIDERRPAARPLWQIAEAVLARPDQLDRVRRRRRHAGGDPAAQALQAHPGHPDRRRGRHDRGRRVRPGPSAGVKVLGPLPQGLPSFALPWIDLADLGDGGDRRLRRRHGVVRRHQRAVAHLCGEDPHPGRSEPGDGRPGRRQPGRRTVPGVSDQQQFVAHAGRRGRGRARRS